MSAREIVAAALALLCSGCSPSISVRPVEYRLKGHVAGPLNHGVVIDGRSAFADTFCATLDHVKSSGEMWNACGDYLELDKPASFPMLAPIPSGTKILLVAGIFSECLESSGVAMFKDAARHLTDSRYHAGITVQNVPVPALGSSEANAAVIRQFIMTHPGPYIAVGYSKGAGDLMEAIERYDDVRAQIRALATVAGAVGGSRLPDQFPGEFLSWANGLARAVGLPGCKVADGGGLASLSRPDRQAFLQRYRIDRVPAFSIAAVADKDRISKILKSSWDLLHAFSQDQDSQVISEDAVVPGGTFLGVARADHWAVALPFAETTDPAERRRVLQLVDRNTYPRTALLEAIIRFVLDTR